MWSPAPLVPPDLTVLSIEVRDATPLALVSPTAGNSVVATVTVQNRSRDAAPDVALRCFRAATRGGRPQAEASVRTGPLTGNAQRAFSLTFAGASQAGAGSISCEVDSAKQVEETDETNNVLTQAFTTEAGGAIDFQIEFRNLGTWTISSSGQQDIPLDIVNTSNRQPLPPPASGPRAGWQAICHVIQVPGLMVQARGNASRYPSGDLPAAGQSQRIGIWLGRIRTYRDPATLPATLQMICALTVGAFADNGPVVHLGDRTPSPDWYPLQVWRQKTVTYSFPNPDAR